MSKKPAHWKWTPLKSLTLAWLITLVTLIAFLWYLPLGVAANIKFETPRQIHFEPGDTLVLATDGFFEWAKHTRQLYGIERLEGFVAIHAHMKPHDFIHDLHADVISDASGSAQPDDLTVVIVKRSVSSGALEHSCPEK